MKKRFEKFKNLKTAQKISAVIAAFATAAVMIGLPIYAWFSASNNLETFTKVKEPDSLDIRSGHYNSIINFELSDIDIENIKTSGKAEYRVFSVNAGDYKIPYIIQLAHTTNIPLKYSLYFARELEDGESPTTDSVAYKPIYKDPGDDELDGTTYYYNIDETRDREISVNGKINLTLRNGDTDLSSYYGRTLAKNNDYYYGKTYDEDDEPEIYAIPLYWQSAVIKPLEESTNIHDYFILKIEWDGVAEAANFAQWNRAENNKETDIIYISANRASLS